MKKENDRLAAAIRQYWSENIFSVFRKTYAVPSKCFKENVINLTIIILTSGNRRPSCSSISFHLFFGRAVFRLPLVQWKVCFGTVVSFADVSFIGFCIPSFYLLLNIFLVLFVLQYFLLLSVLVH